MKIRVRVIAIFVLVMSNCGVRRSLAPELQNAEVALFSAKYLCSLSETSTQETAKLGMDRIFRTVTYAARPGRTSLLFCIVTNDPNQFNDPNRGWSKSIRDIVINPCSVEFDAKAGSAYEVTPVEVRNVDDHCHVSYTLVDASGRPVAGCTLEYDEGCPLLQYRWTSMSPVAKKSWPVVSATSSRAPN